MNRREKLIDNYEDALFAVLMDKVAEEEGAKLREENQRLKADPSAEVPEHVDAVARQTIRKAYASQNRRSALHIARRVLNTVAVLVLICSALFATAYAAFPDVRVQTLNLLIQSSNVASRLSLMTQDSTSGHVNSIDESFMLCGYSIPEIAGFSVVEREEDKHGGWIRFENSRGGILRISIITNGTEYIDTENTDSIEEVQIHGHSGMMIEKGNNIFVTWTENNQKAHITLTCSNLKSSFALQVADQITIIS